jgi:DNA-binding CsgD family transcriptional regulator
MSMKLSDLFATLCFTAFVFWLLSTGMDGPLPAAIGIPNASSYFLPIHIPFLLLIGFFCPYRRFNRLAPANCILSAALTLALAWADASSGRYLLMLLGASGAFITIGASVALRRCSAPLLCAAGGLAIANLLFLPLSISEQVSGWHFAAVAIPLLAIPVLSRRLPDPVQTTAAVSFWHYLPFIVVFQIVSGLMYSFLMPAYYKSALLPGFELFFYIAAVFAAFWLARKNRDLVLVCGVVLGMASFALLHNVSASPLQVDMSMFAMQAAAGFIDLAIIAILLAFPNPVRAFGIGTATLCTGIVLGKIAGYHFSDISEAIVLTGNIILNLSILTLYFLGRHHYGSQTRADQTTTATPQGEISPALPGMAALQGAGAATPPEAPGIDRIEDRIPAHLRLMLSERELYVLIKALEGRTYRETARELEISESTVKTYMVRIYEKAGVKKKKDLLQMLNGK